MHRQVENQLEDFLKEADITGSSIKFWGVNWPASKRTLRSQVCQSRNGFRLQDYTKLLNFATQSFIFL